MTRWRAARGKAHHEAPCPPQADGSGPALALPQAELSLRPWPRAPEHYKHAPGGRSGLSFAQRAASGSREDSAVSAPGPSGDCQNESPRARHRSGQHGQLAASRSQRAKHATMRRCHCSLAASLPGSPALPTITMAPSRSACETRTSRAQCAHSVSDSPRLRPASVRRLAPHTPGPGPRAQQAGSASSI